MLVEPAQARDEWRMYWTLVLAATIGFSFHAVASYSIGLFMEPLNREFGWSRAQVSAGLTISALLSIPLSPMVGAMIDRWGSRRLALIGLVMKAISIAIFSLADGSVWQWYAMWVFYAVVALGVKSTVWTAAVSGSFNSARGLALAVTLCGTAISQTLAPPIARWLIEEFGWRAAFVWLGLGWGAPALIICYFFMYDAYEKRVRRQSELGQAIVVPGLSVAEALRSLPLLRIAAATLIIMTIGIGFIVHLVPILSETGFSREKASYIASLAGLAGIAGKLITGLLLDHCNPGKVSSATMVVMAIAFVLLLEPISSPGLVILSMIIVGYSAGCIVQICAFLTSLYAGLKNFGKIFGVMASMMALGTGLGPLIAGSVRDTTGSYCGFITAAIPLAALGALLLYGLGAKHVHR